MAPVFAKGRKGGAFARERLASAPFMRGGKCFLSAIIVTDRAGPIQGRARAAGGKKGLPGGKRRLVSPPGG